MRGSYRDRSNMAKQLLRIAEKSNYLNHKLLFRDLEVL